MRDRLCPGLGHHVADEVECFPNAKWLADIAVNWVLGENLAQPQFFGAGDDDDLHVRVKLLQPLERFGAIDKLPGFNVAGPQIGPQDLGTSGHGVSQTATGGRETNVQKVSANKG